MSEWRESSCSGLLNIPPVSQESESSDEDEVEDIDPANADSAVDHDDDGNDKSAEVADTKTDDKTAKAKVFSALF